MVIQNDKKLPVSMFVNRAGIIEVTLEGRQSAQTVNMFGEKLTQLISEMRDKHKKVYVLVDVTKLKVSDIDSGARMQGKHWLEGVSLDAIAVVGSTQLLNVATYMVRMARPSLPSKFFKNTKDANAWLLHQKTSRKHDYSSRVGLWTGLLIMSIGLLGLVGWQLSNKYLTSFMPSLRPINPMAAVGLLIIGYGFITYWQRKMIRLRIGGVVTFLLGIVSLLPLHTHYLLYGDRVTAAGPHTHLAASAAICFMCMGVVAFIAGRPGKVVMIVEYIAAGTMAVLSLLNLFGLLYAHDFIYGLGVNFVMALNLATAFAIASIGLMLLILYRNMGSDILASVTRIGWWAVLALIFMQFATYASWSQAITRNENESRQMFLNKTLAIQNSTDQRVQAYRDALRGFQGLYAASSFVSQGEFQTYFSSLKLNTTYPGLRTMAYIAAVKTQDLPAFVAQRKADDSLLPGGNPTFAIQQQTTRPLHYIAAYSTDTKSLSGLGRDVTSIPGREQIYSAAIASGQNYASGTVTFIATATSASTKGFFITIPVQYENTDRYNGVVNVNFAYETFFPALLASADTKDIDVIIRDSDGEVIHKLQNEHKTTAISKTFNVPIANSSWSISVEAPKNFGITSGQTRLPMSILLVGQLFSVLLIAIFVSQTRARHQALVLINQATSDLQHERNTIAELHEKDEAILSGLGEGLIAFDKEGRIERMNEAAQRILGWKETEVHGKTLTSAWRAVDMNLKEIAYSHRPIAQAIDKQKTITAQLYYTRKNGQSFPVELNVAPVLANGKLVGAIEVFRDITREQELDKAKGEFVSLASHQLRTPLSAINWYAEMLLNGDAGKLQSEQNDYVREIFEGNQRMIELVNSLLDVSRIELGRMVNEPAPNDAAGVISSIETELMASVKAKKLTLKKDMQVVSPVVADPKQFRMIVQNLMSNAVKYTPDSGAVTVVLRQATAHDIKVANIRDQSSIFFSVKDNGYGIPKDQQRHIFEKLYRADNVRKLDVEGTGLGLYIVKKVVEDMGGRVWFESVESVGTTFSVVLPIKKTGKTP